MTQPSSDWIPWFGKQGMPAGVSPDESIEVMLRHGSTGVSRADCWTWRWRHDFSEDAWDILYWRRAGVADGGPSPKTADAPAPKAALPGSWLASLSSEERKECAVARGFLAYFPDATAAVARHSVRMNEKHNPGEPVHWSRHKSADQSDCEARHLIAAAVDPDALDGGQPEMICKAWRAMADLQLWIEEKVRKGEKI